MQLKMRHFTAFLAFGLTLMALTQGQRFEKNGYHDLVVSIHPDVEVKNRTSLVNNIKAWIKAGNVKLYEATQKYAYIASVKILLPSTWTDVPATSSSGLAYEDGVIRVDKPNPLYEDNPYTIQPGGCGDRGDFIHLTPNFLLNLFEESTARYGQPEKLFVHEWAKLRYGVFEEYGYPGDKKFPLFYYEQTYVDGQEVNTLTPNFCTDVPLNGRREDMNDGGSCKFDQDTNLPDENCVFVASGDNSRVRSSYMSIPFLDNMDHFCNRSEVEYAHLNLRPNKHNEMCSRKPTWEVITENADFDTSLGFPGPMVNSSPPSTTFEVLRPEDERFVFVLDLSNSMDDFDRLVRLKQSSERWVQHEVRDGSSVGVTSFSDEAYTNIGLTQISGQDVRDNIAKVISRLNLIGSTCLGAGLKNGMNVLNGLQDQRTGGVILFVTDGEHKCNGKDQENIDSPKILDRVKSSKVRIITIAFGKSTDKALENLATVSGGKVYFVPDGSGIEDINSALEGSLTFQPEVPSGDLDIVVYNDNFKGVSYDVQSSFTIDKSLGRKVKFQMDFISRPTDIEKVEIDLNDGTSFSFLFESSTKTPFVHTFDFLPVGNYKFRVIRKNIITYLNIVISSKSASQQDLPFHTRCWVSTGTNEADMQKQKVSILAQVSQGNRPVLNAKVQAFVENGDEAQALTLDLFDNGSGADVIANDGIYSRYFVITNTQGQDGEYTLRCQVKGDEDTNFVAQKQETQRFHPKFSPFAYPVKPSRTTPVCCGSNADSDSLIKEPTGVFERKVNGASFQVKNVPTSDVYPPNQIKDLLAEYENGTLKITFTAPGDNYDSGIAESYDLRLSRDFDVFINESRWEESTQINDSLLVGGDLEPLEAGQLVQVNINQRYFANDKVFFFAVKAMDKSGNIGPISNIFRMNNRIEEPAGPADDGLSGGAIAGIVIGVLLAILVVLLGVYLVVFKRRGIAVSDVMKKTKSKFSKS